MVPDSESPRCDCDGPRDATRGTLARLFMSHPPLAQRISALQRAASDHTEPREIAGVRE